MKKIKLNEKCIELKNLFQNIVILILITLFIGCECVPEINTPKIISPDDYSNTIMLNAIPDRDELLVESNEVPLLNPVLYDNPDNNYRKINAGNSFLRLIDSKSKISLFNLPIELEKGQYYTIIFYGYRFSAQALIFEDNYSQNNQKSFFRFVHTSFDSGNLTFRLSGNTNFENNFNFRSYSELNEIDAGNYNISVLRDGIVLLENNIQISAGNLYSFVLKGTNATIPLKPIQLDMVSSKK